MLLLVLSWTRSPPVERIGAWLDAARLEEPLELAPTRELRPSVVQFELASLHLESGSASPIQSAGGAELGVVFEGEAWMELHPPDPGQELGLAQDFAKLGLASPRRLDFHRAVLLGVSVELGDRVDGPAPDAAVRELGPLRRGVELDLAQRALDMPSSGGTRVGLVDLGLGGRALTLIDDPQHHLGQHDSVVAWSWSPGRVDAALSRSGPGRGPTLVGADLEVRVQERAGELHLDVDAELLLEGRDTPAQLLRLASPSGILPGSFEVVEARVGRRSVLLEDTGEGLLVVLSEPLDPGDQARLELRYSARVAYDQSLPEGARTGPATGLVAPIPQLSTRALTQRTPFRLRVAVDEDSELLAAMSTPSDRSWEAEGLRWVEGSSELPIERPMLALGAWAVEERAATEGLPALLDYSWSRRSHARSLDQAEAALEALAELLGPSPWERVQLVEGPVTMDSVFWQAGAHLIQRASPFASPQTIAELLARSPRWPESFTFHELAHAWFGHEVGAADPQAHCAIEALAEVSACLAMGRVHPGACEEQQRAWRSVLAEGPARLSASQSLAAPDRARRCYVHAPFVLLSALEPVAGRQALEALPAELARRHAGSTLGWAEVYETLASLSEQDLEEDFRFWIEAGWLPEIVSRSRWEEGELRVQLEPDVPGAFHVPVQVGEEQRLLRIDGPTELRLAVSGLPRVGLDPLDQLPLRARTPRAEEPPRPAGSWLAGRGAEIDEGWIVGPADSAARLPLSGGDWSDGELLELVIEAEAAVEVEVQLFTGRRWYWRKVELRPGLNELALPLAQFRWGEGRPPSWGRVDALQIWLRGPGRLRMESLDLVRGLGPAEPDLHELAPLLTGEPRALWSSRVQLLTDDPELDLEAVELELERARARLASRWPELTGGRPPLLVVSATREGWLGLLQAWAGLLNASLEEPRTGGLTLQDVATSYATGPEPRPVFTHELTHAMVARSGVLPEAPGSCLHEGLASWVQLGLHPQPELDAAVRAWGDDPARREQLLRLLRGEAASSEDASYALCATAVDLLGARGLPLRGLLDGRYAEEDFLDAWAAWVARRGLPEGR